MSLSFTLPSLKAEAPSFTHIDDDDDDDGQEEEQVLPSSTSERASTPSAPTSDLIPHPFASTSR